jgi:DNA-binding transcriptional LysR family regulator
VADFNNIIRIGTSPMTPSGFLVDLWPKIHAQYPEIKFKLITFENTPENAREILRNYGKHIDVIAGWFDAEFLQRFGCAALELSKDPIRCAVSMNHRLAKKDKLTIQDLHGENLMLNRRIWNGCLNELRQELLECHSSINIIDFEFYDVNIFNQCENSNSVLMTFDAWKHVHPLLKILPVEWEYTVPFGLQHSLSPSKTVKKFLNAVQMVWSGSTFAADN